MDAKSTFAIRFDFARIRQRMLGTWQEDQALAEQVGVAPSRIAEYKARTEAPSAARTLALAQACGVDPGWLAFGEDSQAPAPEGFASYFESRLRARAIIKGVEVEPRDVPAPRPGTKAAEQKGRKRA